MRHHIIVLSTIVALSTSAIVPVHAQISDAGLELVRSAQATHFASVQAAFFDQLRDDEIAMLARVFGRFAPRAAGQCDASG